MQVLFLDIFGKFVFFLSVSCHHMAWTFWHRGTQIKALSPQQISSWSRDHIFTFIFNFFKCWHIPEVLFFLISFLDFTHGTITGDKNKTSHTYFLLPLEVHSSQLVSQSSSYLHTSNNLLPSTYSVRLNVGVSKPNQKTCCKPFRSQWYTFKRSDFRHCLKSEQAEIIWVGPKNPECLKS